MVKTDRFTFKLDAEDRRLLGLLAQQMRRSQSDALRSLIRMAAEYLDETGQGDYMVGDADRPEDWARGALPSAGGKQ